MSNINQELNRQAVRSIKALQSALLELLKEKQYEKITITEIAAKSGLTRATFYAHFISKDDLLASYLEKISESYIALYRIPTEWTPRKNMLDIEREVSFFRDWKNLDEIIVLIHEPYIEELIYNEIRKMHLKAYREIISPLRPDVNPCFANYWIEFLASTKVALLRNWVKNDMKESPEILGELLYSLSGVHVFERTLEEFKDRIC
jgi:AcrR family transcriptional regulator